jgi:amino acid adenylation domain-containing protein
MTTPVGAPLSFEQQRVWFANEFEPGWAYHVPFAWRLSGDLDVPALAAAVDDLLGRHRVLRTVFPAVDDGPRQVVLPVRSVFSTAPGQVTEFVRRGFDLAVDFPVRFGLFGAAPDFLLVVVFHHIAVDGWSLGPLTRDLSLAYAARRRGRAPAWPPLPAQYADYAVAQRKLAEDEAEQLSFWHEALAGLPEELTLPADRPRPPRPSPQGGEVPWQIAPAEHHAVQALARDCGVSAFMVAQAALAATLTRLGAGEDIPIGAPVTARLDPAFDDVIGFCANTLVLRTDTAGDPTFRELVARVRAADLDAFEHQDIPFDRLVETLAPERVPGRHPLFQVMLTWDDDPDAALPLADLTTRYEPIELAASPFDLSLRLHPRQEDGALTAVLDYSPDLFDRATAEMVVETWARVLRAMLADPDRQLGDIDVLGDEQREWLLRNGTGEEFEVPDVVLPQLFEAQTARTPGAVALVDGRTELTYRELNDRANRLAWWLVERGAGPGGLVAVVLPRSAECVVAVLAVLKSGAAYLPIDPAYPAERVRLLLDDARPVLTLTGGEGADAPARADLTDEDRISPLRPGDAAYVIYTSGSTGRPKGVVVEHRSVVSYLTWTGRAYQGMTGTSLVHSPFSFDLVVTPLFTPLVVGGRAHLADLLDPGPAVPEALCRFPTTLLDATPSHLPLLDDVAANCSPSTELLLGGEQLYAEQLTAWRQAHPDVVVCNVYGPTEATVSAAEHRIEPGDMLSPGPVPIGRPLGNVRLYVLDERLRLAPRGAPGQLHIAGECVARGYLHRPGLTADRFLPDPFGPPGARMYATGDRVRWRADGNLMFLGRLDDQVKVRGHRVEPGEIAAALMTHPAVSRAVVTLDRARPGDERLVAHVVCTAPVQAAQLRQHLAGLLPAHLVPAAIVLLDEMPLTTNGKLDLRALPAVARDGQAASRMPLHGRERVIAELFAEVLGVTAVGADDNFFALGGHSMSAVRLAGRLKSTVDSSITVRTVFQAPTVAELAALTDSGPEMDPQAALLPLRTTGAGPALFCIHPVAGLSWCYAALTPYVPTEIAVYGVQAPGLTDAGYRPNDLADLASDYLRTVLEAQPTGPYRLLGWSFGGLVAQAMATQLQRMGHEVDFLALLDSYPGSGADEEPVEPALRGALGELRHLVDRAAVTRVIQHNCALADRHVPVPYTGNALLVRASGTSVPSEVWRPFVAGELQVHEVPDEHDDLLSAAAVAAFGPVLSASLHALTTKEEACR